QHPDEERMEIGAVSPLVLTGPDGVTAAPPGSALVIAHRAVDVVVKGPDLRGAGLAPAAFPLGELANDAREWDQLVGRLVEHRAQVGVGRRRARGYPRRGTTLDDEPHDQVSDHGVGLARAMNGAVPSASAATTNLRDGDSIGGPPLVLRCETVVVLPSGFDHDHVGGSPSRGPAWSPATPVRCRVCPGSTGTTWCRA